MSISYFQIRTTVPPYQKNFTVCFRLKPSIYRLFLFYISTINHIYYFYYYYAKRMKKYFITENLCIQKNYLCHARHYKTYLRFKITSTPSIIFKSNCALGSFSFHVSSMLLPPVRFSSEIVSLENIFSRW